VYGLAQIFVAWVGGLHLLEWYRVCAQPKRSVAPHPHDVAYGHTSRP
jgi:hypothetical protein